MRIVDIDTRDAHLRIVKAWIACLMTVILVTGTPASLFAESADLNPETSSRPARLKDDPRMKTWGQMLLWGMILLLILLVGSLAIVISLRHFKASLADGRSEPTPVDDVWAMHRLPPELEELEDDDPADGEADDSDG